MLDTYMRGLHWELLTDHEDKAPKSTCQQARARRAARLPLTRAVWCRRIIYLALYDKVSNGLELVSEAG